MPRTRKLLLLAALYLVQGLPYGFQATALPAWLRESGVSLAGIGFLTLLAAPWSAKVLWAPLVDRTGPGRLGRRRRWLLPLQLILAATCAAAAFVPVPEALALLLALVFVMNLVAATQDIAVDGLAVDLLEGGELGYGNAAQVVGFKVGMLLGGGLLVWATRFIGWSGLFLCMAGATLGAALLVALFREPPPLRAHEAPPGFRAILATALAATRRPGMGWVLAFIATYKLGETLIDVMFKPFLVDQGYTTEQIGLWVGSWGLGFSIVGSLAGGVLASRQPLVRAVGIAALLRVGPLVAEWALAAYGAPEAAVIATTCAEHFFGGVLTTTMFAFMMAQVDRRIGATHFTLLAVVEVVGKAPAGLVSGVLAQTLGYPGLFALGCVLSLAFLLLLVPLRRITPPPTGAREASPPGPRSGAPPASG